VTLSQDLDRAAAVFADAVLILAPNYPLDPAAADMQLGMMTLSLGRYLQDAQTSMRKQMGDNSFVHAPHRLWQWMRHGKVRTRRSWRIHLVALIARAMVAKCLAAYGPPITIHYLCFDDRHAGHPSSTSAHNLPATVPASGPHGPSESACRLSVR
jgi:hypothetical protein